MLHFIADLTTSPSTHLKLQPPSPPLRPPSSFSILLLFVVSSLLLVFLVIVARFVFPISLNLAGLILVDVSLSGFMNPSSTAQFATEISSPFLPFWQAYK